MPDIFSASLLVVWTLTGHAAVVERSEPFAEKSVCEQAALEMAEKHNEFYQDLPVKLLPRCEKWDGSGLPS